MCMQRKNNFRLAIGHPWLRGRPMVAPTLKGERTNLIYCILNGECSKYVATLARKYWRKGVPFSENKESRRTSFGPSGGRIQGQQPLVCFLASVLCQMTKNAKKTSQYCGTKTTNRTGQQQRAEKFFASFLSRKRKNRIPIAVLKQRIGQVSNNAPKSSLRAFFQESEKPSPSHNQKQPIERKPLIFFHIHSHTFRKVSSSHTPRGDRR